MSAEEPNSFISELMSQELTQKGKQRTVLSNHLSLMKSASLFILLVFTLIALIKSEWLLGGILGFSALFVEVAWRLAVKGTLQIQVFLTLSSGLAFILYTYLLQTGGINGTGILWAVLLPTIFAILNGTNSLFWNALFLITNGVWFGGLYVLGLTLPYNSDDLIQFTGAFLFVSAISYLLESHRLSQQFSNNYAQFNTNTLLNNSSDIISIIDPLSRLLYVSPANKTITGFEDEEVIGKMGIDFVHPDDRLTALRVLSQVVVSKETHQLRYRYSTKDGGWIWLESKGVRIRNKQGEWMVLLNTRDVTQQVGLEEALQQSHKMEAVGTLAGGLAHNVNNMLAAITNHVFLSKSSLPSDSPLQDRMTMINNLAMDTSEMIDQLLSFARKRPTLKKQLDLTETMQDTMALIRESIPSNISIHWHAPSEPIWINGDQSQLQQSLINLLLNARDACQGSENPNIHCELFTFQPSTDFTIKHGLEQKTALAHLRIRDNGHGIPKDIQEHIFEPFYTTKGVGQGVGLGLSMVHGTIKSHGGIITLDHQTTQGACFDIYIPLPQTQPPLTETATNIGADSNDSQQKRLQRILIVDDSDHVRESTSSLLSSLGYEVFQACDGEEAITLFESNPHCCNLVLMDIIMPKVSGIEAARVISQLSPSTAIIFFSAYADDDPEQQQSLPEGSIRLPKPIAPERLVKVIRETLYTGEN